MNKITRKLVAVIAAEMLAVTPAVSAYASGPQIVRSGIVPVSANVSSVYYLELPASISFIRDEPDSAFSEKHETGDMFYSASYECNVYGVLLGQKITFAPKLNSENGRDRAGEYHIELDPVECDEEGRVKKGEGGGKPWKVDSKKAVLPVTVTQDVYEWIPANDTRMEEETEDYQHRISYNGEGRNMAHGVLNTECAALPDTTYRGTITFHVSCENIA